MTSLRIIVLLVANSVLFLTVGVAVAQVQPYLKMIPSGGAPDTAEMGTQVGIYGSGFCQTGCSPVTLTIGNDVVAPSFLATVQVNPDGTFVQQFTVNVPFAWRYLITATQTSTTGTTLSSSVPMIVPQGDEAPENTPPPPQNQPQANERRAQAFSQRAQPMTTVHGLSAGVTEVPPNEAYDGRSVAVDVSTSNNAVAIAASESGGLWKTTNTGANWSLLSGLPTFRMSDVKMALSNDQIVIATSWFDSHVTNGGGIWRSIDGGATWAKPATADPPSCPTPFNTWGISFAPGTNDVFVGTDCGLSVSHDLGSTWSHVTLPAVYSVIAQPGGSGTIVDTCGADGHHRSTNGGALFTPFSAALPACPFIGVHAIGVSPLESKVLFAAIGKTSIYESDDGGASWANLNPPANKGSRLPWVATHLSADGNPKHFDIYFGSGLNTYSQTCTNTGGPGLRCSTSWNTVTLDHSDQNGLAFSTSGNCAQYIVSDGGIHTTSDCGSTWTITGNGPGGYHALQVYDMTGEVHPTGTDLYFGTQDNNLWASSNNGSTWPNSACCDGFFVQTPHNSPSDSGQTITFVACCFPGTLDKDSAADFVSVALWNSPPGGGGNPFVVDQKVYLQWSAPSPPTNQLYISIDTGGSWNAIPGASTKLQLVDHPFISGPPANPTVYQQVRRAGGVTGLIKITGVRSGSATVTNADTGLNNIGFWSMGQATFRFQQVFGVDPSNPQHLIAGDIGLNQMMVSIDGGMSWNADTHLTDLVTDFGQFQFSQPSTTYPGLTTEAHAIAFDPSNGNRILVGTEQAGIIVSTDGGTTWGVISGSNSVPAVSSFFFDEVQKDVMASSYGRGLWELDLSQLVVFPPSITKAFGAATIQLGQSTSLTFTITNPNATPGLTGVVFIDNLPAGLVQTGSIVGTGCGAFSSSGLPNAINITNATIVGGGTCTITATVVGFTPGVKNNATSTITANESSGSGTAASATITVVAPPAITKAFAAPTVPLNQNTTLTFTITNPNGTVALSGVGFTDTLPSGLAAVGPVTSAGSCPATVLTFTASVLTASGITLPPLGTCTLTIVVKGTVAGVDNNTTSRVTSIEGGLGNTASASITVVAPPVTTKSFGLLAIPVGGSSSLSFTITNPNATVALTVSFTDALPPGLVVSTPNGAVTTCLGGTLTAIAGTNSISLSGAVIAATASCTITVDVTGVSAGVQNNTTGPVSSIEGGNGAPALASIFVGPAFQVRYTSNLSLGDGVINITNTGATGASLFGPGFGANVGNICVNVYAFSPDEQLISCCSCLVTPNGLASLSVVNDLTSNTLTGVRPSSIAVKLLSTVAGTGGSATDCTNSASTAVTTGTLADGLAAWGTSVHPSPAGTAVTETPFTPSTLSFGEAASVASRCTNIIGNGSTFGICRACRSGGLGGVK